MKLKPISKLLSKIKEYETEDNENIYEHSINSRLYRSIKCILIWILTYILCNVITMFMDKLLKAHTLVIYAGMIIEAIGLVLMANYILAAILCMFSPAINRYLKIFKIPNKTYSK